jgi:hypothetical protein
LLLLPHGADAIRAILEDTTDAAVDRACAEWSWRRTTADEPTSDNAPTANTMIATRISTTVQPDLCGCAPRTRATSGGRDAGRRLATERGVCMPHSGTIQEKTSIDFARASSDSFRIAGSRYEIGTSARAIPPARTP